MDYPYKYCLIVDYDDFYSFGSSQFFYCDFVEADEQYKFFVENSHKCVMYRILKFDNFDL